MLAARPGFEPGISAPKADVLPLHHRAMRLVRPPNTPDKRRTVTLFCGSLRNASSDLRYQTRPRIFAELWGTGRVI